VTVINKNKFLAELSRLLTFMYDEDRQAALAMYENLINEAEDTDALMHMLVSPTRQAVVIARNYNATERKLQVEAQHRDEDDEGELPEFVMAIDKLYQDAVRRGIIVEEEKGTGVLENQVSLFDVDESLFEEEAPAEEAVEEAPIEEAPVEETPVEQEPMDEVDAFLAGFSISEEMPEEEAPAEEAVEEAPAEEAPVEAAPAEEKPATVRKAKGFALFMYILAAVPLTAVGVVLLLVPTILVLGLAALVITVGVAALIAAFSGFAVFADILIVLGAALILLALGLLLLWLFVWLIGGAIVGLIHGAISLGGKWCYKEVAA